MKDFKKDVYMDELIIRVNYDSDFIYDLNGDLVDIERLNHMHDKFINAYEKMKQLLEQDVYIDSNGKKTVMLDGKIIYLDK